MLTVILPMLATDAIFIAISSIAPDSDSPLRRVLTTLYDDGTPVIKMLNWIVACLACQKKGLTSRCSHTQRTPQHFQSWGGQEKIRKLMSHSSGAYERELEYGVIPNPSLPSKTNGSIGMQAMNRPLRRHFQRNGSIICFRMSIVWVWLQ